MGEIEETKICSKCGIEQPLSAFYVHKKTGKRYAQCMLCIRATTNARWKNNPGLNSATTTEWAHKNPGKMKVCTAKAREVQLAHSKVSQAKKAGHTPDGRLFKQAERCEHCGKLCKTQAHHYLGYAPEHWYDVEWLCQSDHRRADHPSVAGPVYRTGGIRKPWKPRWREAVL